MWTRYELKTNAKTVLRRTYWLSFAVCILGGLIAGVSSSYSSVSTLEIQLNINFPTMFICVIVVFSMLYGIFISNPLGVGMCNYFMTSREYDTSIGKIFSAFTTGSYMNTVTTLLLRSVYVFLWSLLLVIPGIIKSYEYYFIPYILAENPKISRLRAFQISKKMTNEKKFEIFVLELSFFGWILLGMLLCCVGMYFVTPYVNATNAELYAAVRTEALEYGYATADELCGFYEA